MVRQTSSPTVLDPRGAHRVLWPLMILRRRFFTLLALLAILPACSQPTSRAVAADDAIRRYHDGQRVVAVRVMLDRLQVLRAAGATQANTEIVMFRTPVASVAQLEDIARQMREAQPDISGIHAYVRPLDEPQAQPQRLTRRFTLRTAAGTDPAPLVRGVHGRVVEVVAYSPDTVICEAESPALIAALDAAAALAQAPGVLFATPLIEHVRSRR